MIKICEIVCSFINCFFDNQNKDIARVAIEVPEQLKIRENQKVKDFPEEKVGRDNSVVVGGRGGQDRNCQGGKLSFRAVVDVRVRTWRQSFLAQHKSVPNKSTPKEASQIKVSHIKVAQIKVQSSTSESELGDRVFWCNML